jgi:hypothetical protein
MGMGLLFAALSGAGQGVAKAAGDYQKFQDDQALMRERAALEEQKQLRIDEVMRSRNVSDANNARQAQVDRIDTAKKGLIDSALDTKYAGSNLAVDDANAGKTDAPLTEDQLSIINQAKQADAEKLQDDPKIAMKAAVKTGDISPVEAAKMGQSAELTQMKMDNLLARAEDKNANMKEIANIRADAMMAAAQLRVDAANQRATNNKIDTATGRMLITSEDANIKASTSQLNMLNAQLANTSPSKNGKPNPEYQTIKEQMDQLRRDINESKVIKAGYLKSMNLMPDKADTATTPEPKAAPEAKANPPAAQNATSKLPEGSTVVGRSNGKLVYQTPDGKRFIEQ